MNPNEPVDARIRLEISQWRDDAPRGAVTTFCAENDITRKTFYAIRARARAESQAAALEPRSRRPKSSPNSVPEALKDEAVKVRSAMEFSGLDHGPISVHDKMLSLGMDAPSVAPLAQIFRARNVARVEPKKKPRAAYRRFVYPAPNACWQLDATEYVLTGGRKCVIFQLQDDRSRLAIATHVAPSETGEAALAVMKKGIGAYGVPQRLLTDNGMALNPSRREWVGQLVASGSSLGVEAISGKANNPTTHGKNERFHQTLFRWLDKQPIAQSHAELQDQVERFDMVYNSERPNQALPGRIIPQQAWDATEIAEALRPKPSALIPPMPAPAQEAQAQHPAELPPTKDGTHAAEDAYDLLRKEAQRENSKPRKFSGSIGKPAPTGSQKMQSYPNGVVNIGRTLFSLTKRMGGRIVTATWDRDGIVFATTEGEVIAEYRWPPKGTAYVGIGKARTRFAE